MKEEWKEYYLYLEWLRDTGITNMFGAGPYLEQEFDLTEQEAREVLLNWMKNYKEISDRFYSEGK